MTPMSTVGGSSLEDTGRVLRRSRANKVIRRRRCSKEAGLGALSAFWVARRSSKRFGIVPRSSVRADTAIRRWARVGGLKEESRTYRVCGGGVAMVCGMEERMRKFSDDDAKDERADLNLPNCARISDSDAAVAAIGSSRNVMCEVDDDIWLVTQARVPDCFPHSA